MTPGRLPNRAALIATLASLAGAMAGGAAAQAVVPPRDGADVLRLRLQTTMAPPHQAMPQDVAALDRALADRDDPALARRLATTADPRALVLDMNWEQTRIFDGAGLTVVLAYVHTLWRVAGTLPDQDASGLRDSAAVYALYALNLVSLDGERCADTTAPANRFAQIIEQAQPALFYLRGLSREDRMTVGSLSLALEAATAPKRRDDGMICSGGLAQYNHDQATPGGYVPVFLSPELWGPADEKLRKALPAELTHYLSTPQEEGPSDAPPGDAASPPAPPAPAP